MRIRDAPCPIPILTVLLVAGCGGQRGSDPVVTRLPSGEVVTTYRSLPIHPLVLDTLAVWDLWSGESGYLFSRLAGAAGDAGGFYLLDSGNRQVVATDPRGRVRTVFGRRGEGPGEFGFPRFLNVVGAQVWVGDIMPVRFSLFDPDGTFRRTIPSLRPLVPGPDGCAILPDGRVLNAMDEVDGRLALLRFDPATGTGDTLAVMESLAAVVIELTRSDGSVVPFDTRPQFAPELHWAWSETGRLVTVTGVDYTFEERDSGGRIRRRLTASTPALEVTAADRETFFRDTRFGFGDGAGVSSEEIRRRWVFAERRPAITGIRIDPLGRIWVLAATPDVHASRTDLFDADHHYLGSLELPALPLAFTPDGTALLRIVREEGREVCFTARIRFRNED